MAPDWLTRRTAPSPPPVASTVPSGLQAARIPAVVNSVRRVRTSTTWVVLLSALASPTASRCIVGCQCTDCGSCWNSRGLAAVPLSRFHNRTWPPRVPAASHPPSGLMSMVSTHSLAGRRRICAPSVREISTTSPRWVPRAIQRPSGAIAKHSTPCTPAASRVGVARTARRRRDMTLLTAPGSAVGAPAARDSAVMRASGTTSAAAASASTRLSCGSSSMTASAKRTSSRARAPDSARFARCVASTAATRCRSVSS